MKKAIIVLAAVLLATTTSYSQNSKKNRQLIKQAIIEYNYQQENPIPPIKFYVSQISSATVMIKKTDKVMDVGLLLLFSDNHYEFIKGADIDFLIKLEEADPREREAFFLNFIDTDNHLGRSDRK